MQDPNKSWAQFEIGQRFQVVNKKGESESLEIVRRTDKTVTIRNQDGSLSNRRISFVDGTEAFKPFGCYKPTLTDYRGSICAEVRAPKSEWQIKSEKRRSMIASLNC